MKLYSEACKRNRQPILDQLRRFDLAGRVVEFASGTGMHAAYFSAALHDVVWQPTDASTEAIASIEAWRIEADHDRLLAPFQLDLDDDEVPVEHADAIFCANLIHVAPPRITDRLFHHGQRLLESGAPLFLYGPFRYEDRELEPSNARFDLFLRDQYDEGGIRLFEQVCRLAGDHQFEHVEDVEMPANNRLQVFRRS